MENSTTCYRERRKVGKSFKDTVDKRTHPGEGETNKIENQFTCKVDTEKRKRVYVFGVYDRNGTQDREEKLS